MRHIQVVADPGFPVRGANLGRELGPLGGTHWLYPLDPPMLAFPGGGGGREERVLMCSIPERLPLLIFLKLVCHRQS